MRSAEGEEEVVVVLAGRGDVTAHDPCTAEARLLSDTLRCEVRLTDTQLDLRRSLIMPPDVFGPHPTTDGGFFHLQGVPLVNFLTAPMYLFDSRDTIDKVHEPSLEPVTRAAIRIIESTRGISAAEMRATP